MHRINPDLVLGMDPAHDDWFYETFIAELATKDVPAIMDSWVMYNSNGFVPDVTNEQARVKRLNPNNRFVPWLRINDDHPDDVAVQGCKAVMETLFWPFGRWPAWTA